MTGIGGGGGGGRGVRGKWMNEVDGMVYGRMGGMDGKTGGVDGKMDGGG